MAYAYSLLTSDVCSGSCYTVEYPVTSIDWRTGVNNTYDIERCAREGFLFYQNEDTREGNDRNGIDLLPNKIEVYMPTCEFIVVDVSTFLLEEKRRKVGVAIGSHVSTGGGVICTTNSVPLMALNATKAGMDGLDVETINKIIMEASEGSKFYEHKKKQQERIDRKIAEMQFQLEKLTQDQIGRALEEVDKLVAEIEANTNMNRYYVHLDMDAFFASVEMRDNPSLRDVPMAVGSESMLSTSNYAARKFGVRAAMPGFIARKLCPQIRIIPCNFKKYQEASRMVEETIREYDENMFMCMDEADLDISKHVRPDSYEESGRDSTAWTIVQEMRKKIESATKLTASAGIAPTRFLAKLCSDIKKPNGQCALDNTKVGIRAFLSAIPIRKVCGIGNVTEQMLKALDIHTCKDLWDKRAILYLLFKRGTFHNLLGIAMGIGNAAFRGVTNDSCERKSLSCERTFIGTSDLTFLENLCKQGLCMEVEKDLKAAGLCCKTITLKIKTTDYEVKTRARSIMERTDSAAKIFEAAWKIFMTYVNEIPDLTIRLMGVRVSSFEEKDNSNAQNTLHRFLRPSINPAPSLALAALPSNLHNSSGIIPSTYDDSWNNESKVIIKEEVDFKEGVAIKEEVVIKEEITITSMSCPVCQNDIEAASVSEAERLMDIHLDECLNRDKVKEVRAEIISSVSLRKRNASGRVANDAKKSKRTSSELPINTFFRKL